MMRQALVVGINQYYFLREKAEDPAPNLKKPANDAEDIAQCLEQFGQFEVHRLPKKKEMEQIDPKGIVNAKDLEKLIQQLLYSPITPETFLLFFAGHGYRQSNENGETEGFLLTSDAKSKEVRGVSLKRLRTLLKESKVRQQIVWLDCCYSGELFNFTEMDLNKYDKTRDLCFIAASREFEYAWEQENGKHGELTNALLEGLDPCNLNNGSDGWVTNRTLKDFISKEISKELKKVLQHPVLHNSGWKIILTGKDGVYSKTCPYKALEYFDFNPEAPEEIDDPLYFYGRTGVIKQLLDKVRNGNFLAVLGASGSGKSSVVRAGLLYQLYLGKEIPGSDKWKIYKPFTPGAHPLEKLGQLLGEQLATVNDLVNFIDRIPNERVMLVVDQFEEVFTQCQDKKKREQFIECLLGTIERIHDKLRLVLVMRSDFQGKCDDYPDLATSIDKNLVRVMQMTSEELREVIEKPAKKVGLEIVPELVNQMIDDVQGSPGDLPLLEYTLAQLWEKSHRYQRLTLEDYKHPDFGGLKETLEKQANKVYDSLKTEEQQQVAEWIFLKLTSIGEGTEDTRRQIRQQDLVNSKHSQHLVDQVLNRLAAADSRLVITSEEKLEGERGEPVVNIAHEALIRNWSKLQEWIAKKRYAELIRRRLEAKVQEWLRLGKSSGGLLDERELDDVQNWCKSLDAQDSGEIPKLDELIAASILVINENKLQQLTTSTETQFASNKQLDALATAIKAGELLKKTSSRIRENIKILVLTNFNQLIYGFRERNSLKEHNQGVLGINFSSDGQRIVSTSRDNTIKIWFCDGNLIQTINEHKDIVYNAIFNNKNDLLVSASRDRTIKIWKLDPNSSCFKLDKCIYIEDQVFNIALSPNNQIIASDTRSGKIKLWDLSGKLIAPLDGHPNERINDLNFSPNGQIIASAGADQCIKLWSTENYNCIDTLTEKDSVYAVNFVDNQTIVSGTGEGMVSVWNLDTKKPIPIGRHKAAITRLAVNQDSKIIASASCDHTIAIWDIQAPRLESEPLKILEGHENHVSNVSFNPAITDSIMLGSSSEDGTIKIWKVISPIIIDGLYFSFAPNSQMIVTGHKDGSIKLWSENGNLQKSFSGHDSIVLRVEFSPNGKTFVSTGVDETVKIWSSEGKLYQTLKIDHVVSSISFSPDGQTIATASVHKKLVDIWDLENGELIHKYNIPTTKAVQNVSFSPDGQTIAVVNYGDNKINFWKLDDEKVINTLTASSSISSISFSKEGHIAAACDKDIVDFWYFEATQYQKQPSKILRGNLWDVAFSPDSQTIIVACEEQTVIVFLDSGDRIYPSLILEPTKFYSKSCKEVRQVGFSPNGKILASTNNSDQIILWNFNLEKLLALTLQDNKKKSAEFHYGVKES